MNTRSDITSNQITRLSMSHWKGYSKELDDVIIDVNNYLEVNEVNFEEFKQFCRELIKEFKTLHLKPNQLIIEGEGRKVDIFVAMFD